MTRSFVNRTLNLMPGRTIRWRSRFDIGVVHSMSVARVESRYSLVYPRLIVNCASFGTGRDETFYLNEDIKDCRLI